MSGNDGGVRSSFAFQGSLQLFVYKSTPLCCQLGEWKTNIGGFCCFSDGKGS